ncbi:DUF2934 domain-containing protein [Acidihalobacter ferrooxydans]|uniref:DUF2934 domain-containing protein n=1 Tax=Acidihalobacter ferrooxydans TaxID=1765967 RepID=A0A1P8UF78_9GAMM|nr:DUF2934 domain-containing protein [Acidihalobacter ferrooxydans]APZ42441.1 hypothetical protein BW247_04515 [Acidihalobacter ferrooxydans]
MKNARKKTPTADTAAPAPVAHAHITTATDIGPSTEAAQHNIEERHRLIAERAYFIAERRGFGPEGILDDWLEAEAIIDRWLEERHTPL